jgi:hypothetical protein
MDVMRSKCPKPFPQLHQRMFQFAHVGMEAVMVMNPLEALPAFTLDHHLMSKDLMPQIVNTSEVQEKQFPVFGYVLFGDRPMVRFQNGGEQFVLEELDLVLEKVQFTEPIQVILVQFIEGCHILLRFLLKSKVRRRLQRPH